MGAIPSGWTVCDGTLGTPDFRNFYLRGANPSNPPGTKTGTLNHTHPFTANPHGHEFEDGDTIRSLEPKTTDIVNATVTGTTGGQSDALKFHSFDLIMKL